MMLKNQTIKHLYYIFLKLDIWLVIYNNETCIANRSVINTCSDIELQNTLDRYSINEKPYTGQLIGYG